MPAAVGNVASGVPRASPPNSSAARARGALASAPACGFLGSAPARGALASAPARGLAAGRRKPRGGQLPCAAAGPIAASHGGFRQTRQWKRLAGGLTIPLADVAGPRSSRLLVL